MDISILLFLQNIREAMGGMLNSFLVFVSSVAVDYYIVGAMLVLYWTVDKKRAAKVMLGWGASLSVGAFLKATFCVYRPWVRDARIQPPAEILSGATGYSFPSGHSVSSGGFWNGIALAYRKHRPLVIFSVCMVLLTMFSRIFLGVHTPQDVLVGAAVSIACAFLMSWVCDLVETHKNADIVVLAVTTVLMVALLLYISLKSYPMDYVDGQLLVDPKKMTVDGFKDPGRFYGIVLGWFIERRFIHFRVEGTVLQKVMRGLVGCLLTVF